MGNEKKSTIRDSIIACRNARGWTQADLAEHINMNQSTYSRKELQNDFKANELLVIADALNVDVKDFFISEANADSPIQKLNEQPKNLISEPDLTPTKKECDVIKVMRSSKQNKDIFLNLMALLHQKGADNEKLNKILEILKED